MLKNPENLGNGKSKRQRLDEALQTNQLPAVACDLKEDLRQFWEQAGHRAAEKFLTASCRRAEASGIRILQTLAKTLRGHRSGLMVWYADRISTGALHSGSDLRAPR